MSSASSTPAPVAKTPFLAAAALFLAVAALVFALAIKPLGAAELLGLLACAAAAAVFATIPFAIDFARRLDASRTPGFAQPIPSQAPAPAATSLDPDQLAAQVAAAVEARLAAAFPALAARITAELAASEDKRRSELQAAFASTPSPARPVDADAVSAPAGAKPRLGRGLLGLMHAPGAISSKPTASETATASAPVGDTEEDRAAA